MDERTYPDTPLLLVDDEPDMLLSYRAMLRVNSITNVVTCSDSRKVMSLLSERAFHLVVLDLSMPHVTGQQLLARICASYPGLPVMVATASDEVITAVECMKNGAVDYLVKPVEENRFVCSVRHALEMRALQDENQGLRTHMLDRQLADPGAFGEIVTRSESMEAIFSYVAAVARFGRPILVTGESGVGKELVARSIHKAGGREGRFVSVNVGGLDDNVFSDTLFGHRKGAFTGAQADRKGLIETAAGGTLFLDEIGTLEPSSQVKLLRVLQEGEYFPLGADTPRTVEAAVVAATNEDLGVLVRDGRFRNDLFYRLNTHHIRVPPLRERPEDIGCLVEHFAQRAAKRLGKARITVPAGALAVMEQHPFRGNVRELESIVFDVAARSETDTLDTGLVAEQLGRPAAEAMAMASHSDGAGYMIPCGGGFPKLREVEEHLMREAMVRAKGNQTAAALLLGISQSTLSRRLRVQQ
ncbi:MAG: response regulator [Chitinivibrionales bacterium]|nr:response regulator [Chitinivibrionales bacterium]